MHVNVEQNTDEWFELRLGRVTSSNFAKVMANSIKGSDFIPTAAFGLPAKKYAQRLALERVTGRRRLDSYTSSYMEAGHEFEPVAIAAYAYENVCVPTNGGFNHIGWVGDSPDANVGSKGSVEVKSVIADTQWERLKKGGIDTTYKWQIQGHIWLGEKEWCDFVSYCYSPEFVDSKRLYIHRVYRDDTMIHRLIQRVNHFQKEILTNMTILES
jgi:hypothetical protein